MFQHYVAIAGSSCTVSTCNVASLTVNNLREPRKIRPCVQSTTTECGPTAICSCGVSTDRSVRFQNVGGNITPKGIAVPITSSNASMTEKCGRSGPERHRTDGVVRHQGARRERVTNTARAMFGTRSAHSLTVMRQLPAEEVRTARHMQPSIERICTVMASRSWTANGWYVLNQTHALYVKQNAHLLLTMIMQMGECVDYYARRAMWHWGFLGTMLIHSKTLFNIYGGK